MKRALGRKVRLGRFGLPIWAIGVAVMVIGVAAGQVVGPVLTGRTTGTISLTVEQAVTLDPDKALGSNPSVQFLVGTGDSATSYTDDGTGFTVAIELVVGQRVNVTVLLQNNTGLGGSLSPGFGDAASVIMELDIPIGIDVEVEETGEGMSEAQLGLNQWLVVLPATAGSGPTGTGDSDDGVVITIRPRDDLKPGFYEIYGRFIQTSGG